MASTSRESAARAQPRGRSVSDVFGAVPATDARALAPAFDGFVRSSGGGDGDGSGGPPLVDALAEARARKEDEKAGAARGVIEEAVEGDRAFLRELEADEGRAREEGRMREREEVERFRKARAQAVVGVVEEVNGEEGKDGQGAGSEGSSKHKEPPPVQRPPPAVMVVRKKRRLEPSPQLSPALSTEPVAPRSPRGRLSEPGPPLMAALAAYTGSSDSSSGGGASSDGASSGGDD